MIEGQTQHYGYDSSHTGGTIQSIHERLNGHTLTYQGRTGLSTLRFLGGFPRTGGHASVVPIEHSNGRPNQAGALKISYYDAPLNYWQSFFGEALQTVRDSNDQIVGYTVSIENIDHPSSPNSPIVDEDSNALRFAVREARVLYDLEHPNICGFEGDELYFFPQYYTNTDKDSLAPGYIMEMLDGRSMDKINHFATPQEKIKYYKEYPNVADCIDYTNRRHNIYHRDIAPSNLLDDNKSGKIKVVDFGNVLVNDTTQATEVFRGTPAFMAPERFNTSGLYFKDLGLEYIDAAIHLDFLDPMDSKYTTATEQLELAATYSASICTRDRVNLMKHRDLEVLFPVDGYNNLPEDQQQITSKAWNAILYENQLATADPNCLDLPDHSDNEKFMILNHFYVAFSKDPTMRFMTSKLFAGLLTNMLIKDENWQDRPIPYALAYELSTYAANVRHTRDYYHRVGVFNGTPYTDARSKLFKNLLNNNPGRILDYLLPSILPNGDGEVRAEILNMLGRDEQDITELDDSTKAQLVINMLESSFNGRRRFPHHAPHVYKRETKLGSH